MPDGKGLRCAGVSRTLPLMGSAATDLSPTARSLAGWPPDALMAALQVAGLKPGQARGAVRNALRAWFAGDADPSASLSRQARVLLAELTVPSQPLALVERRRSTDGSLRLLWRTADNCLIESVIIPSSGGGRTTLCVSSQVGCARRCAFCETGRLGLIRNLAAVEIVQQFQQAHAIWQVERGPFPSLRNVVFMGMGEPLDNLEAVCDAIDVLFHDFGAGLAAQRITVSTVGVPQRIPAFFQRTRAHLAVSLNAPDDARRLALMPVHKHCSLKELKCALQTALPSGRDVLIEYVLFGGVNDALQDADLLMDWLRGLRARLNLIPANPGPDPNLRAPDPQKVRAFHKYLLDGGVRAMVRHPHGGDVGGACGQLAGLRRQSEELRHGA